MEAVNFVLIPILREDKEIGLRVYLCETQDDDIKVLDTKYHAFCRSVPSGIFQDFWVSNSRAASLRSYFTLTMQKLVILQKMQ